MFLAVMDVACRLLPDHQRHPLRNQEQHALARCVCQLRSGQIRPGQDDPTFVRWSRLSMFAASTHSCPPKALLPSSSSSLPNEGRICYKRTLLGNGTDMFRIFFYNLSQKLRSFFLERSRTRIHFFIGFFNMNIEFVTAIIDYSTYRHIYKT